MEVSLKIRPTYYNDSYSEFDLLEAYGGINLSSGTNVQMGKILYNWGKGYAFNPAAKINLIKNPELPDRLEPGLMSWKMEKVISFEKGPLQTFSSTLVWSQPEENVNNIYAEFGKSFAIKGYFLLWDTDIDLMAYTSQDAASSFGIDFSRNVKENLEIHGETYIFANQPKYTIANNTLNNQLISGNSYLLGFRFLSSQNTTFIGEYYHNENGLTKDEYLSYVSFINTQVNSGSSEAVRQALQYSQTYFNSTNLKKDYFYFKITQPEPFNLLYFNPSLYFIFNLNDGSFIASAPLSFERFENVEFLMQPTLIVGSNGTEYGDKQFQSKIEACVKFYF